MQKPHPTLMMFRSQNPLLLLVLLPFILLALIFVAIFLLANVFMGARKKKSIYAKQKETSPETKSRPQQSVIEAEFRSLP